MAEDSAIADSSVAADKSAEVEDSTVAALSRPSSIEKTFFTRPSVDKKRSGYIHSTYVLLGFSIFFSRIE